MSDSFYQFSGQRFLEYAPEVIGLEDFLRKFAHKIDVMDGEHSRFLRQCHTSPTGYAILAPSRYDKEESQIEYECDTARAQGSGRQSMNRTFQISIFARSASVLIQWCPGAAPPLST